MQQTASHLRSAAYGAVHIQGRIVTQPPADGEFGHRRGAVAVACVELGVARGGHWVLEGIRVVGRKRKLAGDDCARGFAAAGGRQEVFPFQRAHRIRGAGAAVVDLHTRLVFVAIRLELVDAALGAVGQAAVVETEELIQRAGEDQAASHPELARVAEIIHAEKAGDAGDEVGHQVTVAPHRQALEAVMRGEAGFARGIEADAIGQRGDQAAGFAAPLSARVTGDVGFVNRAGHALETGLLEVGRSARGGRGFPPGKLRQLRPLERPVPQAAIDLDFDGGREGIEPGKAVHEFPHRGRGAAEVVRPIGMHPDAGGMQKIPHIAAGLGTAFEQQHLPAAIPQQSGDRSPRHAGAHHQVIHARFHRVQQAPFRDRTAPTVRPRMARSRRRLSRRTYSRSWGIMAVALVWFWRSRTCQSPVMPGRTSARARAKPGCGASMNGSSGRGPTRLMSP